MSIKSYTKSKGNQERPRKRISRKQRKRQKILVRCFALFVILLFVVGMGFGIYEVYRLAKREPVEQPELTVDYLTENPYSRPGDELKKVKNIFVHYTANPGTSAAQNRSYFENLKDTQETSASSHFIIGYEGEIIQCIPLEEIAYSVKTRNEDSISIECCYVSEDGKFTEETYQSLIHLVKWLLYEYDLKPKDVLRHYDVGGKPCPLYYVEHEDAWKAFLKEL